MRWSAAALFVGLSALGMATVVRPPRGYSRTGPLVLAMVGGAAAGALALVCLAALVRVAARRRGRLPASLGHTVSSYPVLAVAVAGLVIAVAAVELWPHDSRNTSDAALNAAFSGWQRATVPLVLTYARAVRSLVPATRLTRVDSGALRARVLRAHRTLLALGRGIATEAERYRSSGQLRAMTMIFEQSVRLASSAAGGLGAVLRARRSSHGAPGAAARRAVRRLLRRADAALLRSQQAMQRFTLQANGLGGRLAAGA